MNSRYTNLFRFFFAALDLCLLNLLHIILIRSLHRIWGEVEPYFIYCLVSNIAWLCCGYITALYVNDRLLNFMRSAKITIKAFLLYFFIMMVFVFAYHFDYSRLFVILSISSYGFLLLISRVFFILAGDYLQSRERFNKKVIVIGYNEVSKKLVNYFSANNERIHMEGYFDNYEKIHELSLYPILGDVNDTVNYAIQKRINEIYSTISPEKDPAIYDLAGLAEKNLIHFKFVPDFHLFINRNVHLDYFQEIPILSLRSEPLEDIAARIKKRFIDILFSLGVIIFILSWLAPIIALVIKLSSRGPVLFVQLRSGKNNKNFKCYKFRSLRVNKESDIKQVTKNDNRVTKAGRILRKTNLDELPQFWNVLIGNMSLVGPRPHMLKHTETYSKVVNEYMIRHFIKPGITGWAQVNGFRGEIKGKEQLNQRILYDIWYAENWSVWLDFRIIFLTVYKTFKGDKNAF